MEFITKSHIDDQHASGPYFPMAESLDGLFFWHSVADGYVAIDAQKADVPANTSDGKYRSIYLQYGYLDNEVSAELLDKARSFSRAVHELQESRRRAKEIAEIDAAIAANRNAH